MAWHRKGNKPLSEPMLTQFIDAYMRGTRGRCVKYRKNTGFAGFQLCTRFYKTFYVVPHLLNLCNCMFVASPLSYVNRCCSAVYIFIHTPIEAWTKWLTFCRNKLQSNLNQNSSENTNIFSQENAFENVVCVSVNSLRPSDAFMRQ